MGPKHHLGDGSLGPDWNDYPGNGVVEDVGEHRVSEHVRQVRQLVLEIEYWTRVHPVLRHVDYGANHHDDGNTESHVHAHVLQDLRVLDVSEREHDRKDRESHEAYVVRVDVLVPRYTPVATRFVSENGYYLL